MCPRANVAHTGEPEKGENADTETSYKIKLEKEYNTPALMSDKVVPEGVHLVSLLGSKRESNASGSRAPGIHEMDNDLNATSIPFHMEGRLSHADGKKRDH